jgi:hypothetical protein
VVCDAGEYQPFYVLHTNKTAFSCWSCEASSYLANYTGVEGAATQETGSIGRDQCKCASTYYEAVSDQTCVKCTPGMTCYDGEKDQDSWGFNTSNIVVLPNYWRPFLNSTLLFECEFTNCIGSTNGTGNFGIGLCADGHTGKSNQTAHTPSPRTCKMLTQPHPTPPHPTATPLARLAS